METRNRSMLPQPKVTWKCNCGCDVFNMLMCPDCKGDRAHLVGFQCVSCETIHITPSGGSLMEEHENEVH